MRVLLISKEGDGLGIAQRLVLEGNHVDVWVQDRRFDRAGRGIVNRVPDWRGPLKRADLVLCDYAGAGRLETQFQASGRPFLGANRMVEHIELNRRDGMRLFQMAGVDIPTTLEFATASEARGVPREQEWGHGWVIKPDGNKSTALTMVVTDPGQWEHCLAKVPAGCPLITQAVVKGVEVSTEGWFNGRGWVEPHNHTFEEKRFLAGDLGCNTGCMGNVVVTAPSTGNRLTAATVERLAPFLRRVGYRGPFDINCIVNEEGAWALEATSRMGYDAVEALAEGLEEPLGDFLFEVANGSRSKASVTDNTMIAVRLSIPPWPTAKPGSDQHGEPVSGITPEALRHLFLTDLYQDKDGYKTAGGDGVLLKATAIGRRSEQEGRNNQPGYTDYTREAQRRVYRLLDNIGVSGKQYRVDIGKRVNKDIARLREWGWLS